MLLREQYQEHSERDYLSVPLATYHFEQVTIPLHWHREVELILPQEAGELELERYVRQHSAGIRSNGIEKVLAGETSLDEVLRVTMEA